MKIRILQNMGKFVDDLKKFSSWDYQAAVQSRMDPGCED